MKKKWTISLITEYRNEIYGIAALLIMIVHGYAYNIYHMPADSVLSKVGDILRFGLGGVDIFMLLSGIGVYFSLESSSVPDFYRKRVKRLIPPYLVIAIPLFAWRYIWRAFKPIRFIGALTQANLFLYGDHSYWFIPAIAIFYLLTPLILDYLKKGNRTLRMLLLVTVVILINVFIYRNCKEFWSNAEIVTTRLTTYIFGCYLGKYVKEKTPMPWWAVVLAVCVVVTFPAVILKWQPARFYQRYYYGLFGTALVFVLSMLIDLIHIKPLKKFFLFAGGLSNELYLAHITLIIIIRVKKLNTQANSGPLFFLILVVGAFIVAYGIQKACDYLTSLRKKLAARPRPEPRELPLSADGRVLLWDNLKFFLILTVVVGHFVDGYASDSFRSLFLFIYSFHMPLFIFVSGLFHKDTRIMQKIFRYLAIYALMRGLILGIMRAYGVDGAFELSTTGGAPWFVFSLAVFIGLTYAFRNVDKRLMLVISVFVACIAGYDTTIGDRFMLSRTLVYFPFYVMGTMVTRERVAGLRRHRSLKIAACVILLLWAGLCVFYRGDIYYLRPVFTGRNPFGEKVVHLGFLYRLLCMGIASLVGLSLILLMPAGNLGVFSAAGRKTLQIYFWHRPILYILVYRGVRDILCDTRPGKILWLALACVLTMALVPDLFGFPTETIQRFLKPKETPRTPPES